MGIRENKIETYLSDEVKRVFGGETRKWVSPGHDGVHDQIVFIPGLPAIFVEVKVTDGELSPVQEREHKRLKKIKTTSIFMTVYGHKGVDSLIESLTYRLGIDQCMNRCNRKNQSNDVVIINIQ